MSPGVALAPLADWLLQKGLAGSASAITVQPLSGGQSNPTFRVSTDRGEYVLRKQPPGLLLASAHAIDREYRVMAALADTPVPVPRMLAWCDDASLLGTPFYLMEFLAGRGLADQSLPGAQPAERAALYGEMNRVLAALHAVDPAAVGLGDYGRSGTYVARQVARWSRQCEASTLALPPAMRRLMDWLPQHLPAHDATTVVHGDYRLDNLVFHAREPRVLGVLDWELSTLGDPLADFSYHCMSWRIPASLWRGIAGLDLRALGIPDEASYVRRYEETSGRATAPHWEFYMAYNLFRMAAILHGIAQRAADGTAAAADAVETGRKAAPLAELAWDCALRHQAATR
ncbi:MAG: aminoglycoside phosphotransferase [Comamonadaceae bacterium SCN 68-20]|nr:MAG: aminoglycoside phosphotransferase [Comamonadaceae bacterium SCN 68-20]